MNPVWLREEVILAIHDEQLAEHGGPPGIRDIDLLQSALARPKHLASYGEPDIADIAAAYGYGLARNHPFVDGNKRTAFVAMELFLALKGYELQASDAECVLSVLKLASGDMPEQALAGWLRENLAS
jgi:death-on-curing protein